MKKLLIKFFIRFYSTGKSKYKNLFFFYNKSLQLSAEFSSLSGGGGGLFFPGDYSIFSISCSSSPYTAYYDKPIIFKLK